METLNKNLKTMRNIDRFFIVLGMLEIFSLVFLTHNFWTSFYGLITLIPAYIALNEKQIKWNYFVGIWAVFRFNPFSGIAMVAFVLGDFFRPGPTGAIDTLEPLGILLIVLFALLIIAAFVLGIMLLIKTSKCVKLIKSQNIADSKIR